MKISIVIPNFNGAKLLEKNIPFVLKAANQVQDTEVIVVDDASTDNSKEVLSQFKEIHLLENSKNKGFARSINKGVGYSKGDIVILLNSDVQPDEKFLKPLIKHFFDRNVFAVGCLDKSVESGKTIERGRGIGKWDKGFLVHSAGNLNKETTLWASGGSSAFRKTYFEKLGGFSELFYPFYYEDIDLSYRAWKVGWVVKFERGSAVVHEHEAGAIMENYSKSYIKTIAYKNQFVFIWKNITDLQYGLSHILWLPYHVLMAAFRLDLAFFVGFLRALALLPLILRIKKKNSRLFVRSDKKVIGSVEYV